MKQSSRTRSGSNARPGPMTGSHHPPSPPARMSPVSAWTSSTVGTVGSGRSGRSRRGALASRRRSSFVRRTTRSALSRTVSSASTWARERSHGRSSSGPHHQPRATWDRTRAPASSGRSGSENRRHRACSWGCSSGGLKATRALEATNDEAHRPSRDGGLRTSRHESTNVGQPAAGGGPPLGIHIRRQAKGAKVMTGARWTSSVMLSRHPLDRMSAMADEARARRRWRPGACPSRWARRHTAPSPRRARAAGRRGCGPPSAGCHARAFVDDGPHGPPRLHRAQRVPRERDAGESHLPGST